MCFIFNKKGYTLIELMVSIFIIGITSSILLANFKSYNQQSDLKMDALLLSSQLRSLQSDSLGLREMALINDFPSGGWGAYFNINNLHANYLPNGYRIFGDYGDGVGGLPDTNYNNNEFERLVELADRIEIISIEIDGVPDTVLQVIYEPPDPITHICNATVCTGVSAKIMLQNIDGGRSAVEINTAGLIDVTEKD